MADAKTKAAMIIFARLPEGERKIALSVVRAANKIYTDLQTAGSLPIAEHPAYQRHKGAVQEVLTALDVEFQGGNMRGSVKIARIK